MEEIYLPPYAPVLIESTRALGYSLEAAIADLLDNSVSAESTEIDIHFWPYDEPYLSISDNGYGMTAEELTNAMRYGSKSPLEVRAEKDMGRYGLGMKTATLSQCRSLVVASWKNGELSGRCWDLDIINQRKEWILLSLSKEEINKLPNINLIMQNQSGTLVVWRKFDRMIFGEKSLEQAFEKKMDRVRSHISMVFHRYLTGELGIRKVKISMNELAVTAKDPFLIGKSEQIMDVETILIEGQKISVVPYILPHISKLSHNEIRDLGGEEGLRKQQGFYIYRNKRLLVWGTWFRLQRKDELFKLARIMVDIPNSLDHLWTLDIRKSIAIPPEIVKTNLERIVNRISEGSRRTWTFRGRKETNDTISHFWERCKTRNGIKYKLNRDHVIVDAFRQKLNKSDQTMLENLLGLIEESIPLNALYVDLVGDEHFDTVSTSNENLSDLIRTLLKQVSNDKEEMNRLISILEGTEPFSQDPELVESIKREVLINE